MIKLQDIKTYSRYYPTLFFERREGEIAPYNKRDLVDRLRNIIPGAKITFYRTFGKLHPNQEQTQRIFNVIILPYEAQRMPNDNPDNGRANFELFAFRIQMSDRFIALSCWLSIATKKSLYTYFSDKELLDIYEDTAPHVRPLADDNTPFANTWLNYLRAVEALSCYTPLFKQVLAPIMEKDEFVSSLSTTPIQYALNEDFLINNKLSQIEHVLRNHILRNNIDKRPVSPGVDASFHTHAVTYYPEFIANYMNRNDQYLTYVNTTDEALAYFALNMRMAYFGTMENKELSLTSFGESFCALYKSLQHTVIAPDIIETELIASLWKAIDSRAITCTYVGTSFEGETHYGLFFRCGRCIHPVLRFVILSLVISDLWRKHRLEDTITVYDLDQLLSIISVPESPFFDKMIGVDSDFIDLPNANCYTIINGMGGRYVPAINALIRIKVYEMQQWKNIITMSVQESDIVRILRETDFYQRLIDKVTPILKAYLNHYHNVFNFFTNTAFYANWDKKRQYLRAWLDQVRHYVGNESVDKAVGAHLTSEIGRISLMSQCLVLEDIEQVQQEVTDPKTYQVYNILKQHLPSADDVKFNEFVAVVTSVWFLYYGKFINDIHDVDVVYMEVQENLKIFNILGLPPYDDRDSLRAFLIDLLTNHFKL